MKQAVIYGGGNIGRGFIGQLFYESGYSTTFIDINSELIDNLNKKKEYRIFFTDTADETIIKNVCGVFGGADNLEEILKVISKADIMAVSVGANILSLIAPHIAEGINRRFADKNFEPFDIILCENLIGADKIMREAVRKHINNDFLELYTTKIGFVESSIGRMVPIQTEDTKHENPLKIITESYKVLPVDKAGFKGEIPQITGMIAHSPFEFFIERKLYIHNLGHAVCAYLGSVFGYDYIWQAIDEPYIEVIVLKTMQCSAAALSKKYDGYHTDIYALNLYIKSLICRFKNKALSDTVLRVGIDLKRKLSPKDRIFGAYKLCKNNGVFTHYICLAAAAAAGFKGDKLSGAALETILGEAGSLDLFDGETENFILIQKYYNLIQNETDIKGIYNTVENDENKAMAETEFLL